MGVNDALQDRFLSVFFRSQLGNDFYLTGGTALARFYFHHRESVDVDLFTQNQGMDFADTHQAILSMVSGLGLSVVRTISVDAFLQYICEDAHGVGLKIDVVKDVPIHFGEIVQKDGIRLDALENIGANKILAVFGRTDAKDFIDLYWILKKTDFTFDHLFALAKRKDVGLEEIFLSYALDKVTDLVTYPTMLVDLPWDAIKIFYQDLSRQLLLNIKPQ
ncbi:MAG: nucleotidyl transferase AbiEii/AbiGii toxin family protein [Candidatus Gottesmanbacteria bacterium]|nr:nucleotidyl transferase AbiEii/AbiGii toxin family protein [Candidatus Gottesmanbacteria bacterium]